MSGFDELMAETDRYIQEAGKLRNLAEQQANDKEQLALVVLDLQRSNSQLRALYEGRDLADINPENLLQAFMGLTAMVETVTDAVVSVTVFDKTYYEDQAKRIADHLKLTRLQTQIAEDQESRLRLFEKLDTESENP